MSTIEKIELLDNVLTRQILSPKARALFNFVPEEHSEALGMNLMMYPKKRLLPGPERFTLTKGSLISHVAGLYWVDFCINSGKFGREGSRERMKAVTFYETRLAHIAEFLSNYLLALCAGEFRHGLTHMSWKYNGECEKCKGFFIIDVYHAARSQGSENVWEKIRKSSEPTYGAAWDLLIHAFCDHSWDGGGVGGPRWGYLAYTGRNLFCSWVEGDIVGMARYLDFILHAVHNGANCLNDKFEWISMGNVNGLVNILNAKFESKECCWGRISYNIHQEYKLIQVSALTCPHKTQRDLNELPSEEKLFSEVFLPLDRCKVCQAVVKINGMCETFCHTCRKCTASKYHSHRCNRCGITKKNPDDQRCQNFCQICFDIHKEGNKRLYRRHAMAFTDPDVFWLGQYPGCLKDYRYFLHHYCHDCGAVINIYLRGTIGRTKEGEKVMHSACSKKSHKAYGGNWQSYCPMSGKCLICSSEVKADAERKSAESAEGQEEFKNLSGDIDDILYYQPPINQFNLSYNSK